MTESEYLSKYSPFIDTRVSEYMTKCKGAVTSESYEDLKMEACMAFCKTLRQHPPQNDTLDNLTLTMADNAMRFALRCEVWRINDQKNSKKKMRKGLCRTFSEFSEEQEETIRTHLLSQPHVDAIDEFEVEDALSSLPPVEKSVFRMVMDGYSQTEIALELGMSLNEVKSAIYRARVKLKQLVS